jgi:hypothetical protein
MDDGGAFFGWEEQGHSANRDLRKFDPTTLKPKP